jgi:hypothetical protein
MFYTEEDVTPAVQIATELFGPVGNMLQDSRFVSQNVIIGTREFGKLWYGDVEGTIDYVNELCEILGKRINQQVSIVSDQF